MGRRRGEERERKKPVHHRHPFCPVQFLRLSFLPVAFQLWRRGGGDLKSLGLCCLLLLLLLLPLPEPRSPPNLDALRERGAALRYGIWKLLAARQRQAVARCVQDREPCFSTGSPGITSKGSWRKWRDGRKASRAWPRVCSSTGESR